MNKSYNNSDLKARFEIHKKTFVLKTVGLCMGNTGHRNIKPGIKQAIKKWSPRSKRAAKLKFEDVAEYMETFITLTYPLDYLPNLDGKECKKHLNSFLQSLRNKFRSNLLFTWVLEFTKKGCPHFHLTINQKLDMSLMQWVSKRWYTICKTGNPKHLLAGTNCETVRNPEACSLYLANYLSKHAQKLVPESFCNVGRFWGCSRSAPKPQVFEIDFIRDVATFTGEFDLLKYIRPFRKYNEAKIRYANKARLEKGLKPFKPRSKTGFTCWGGTKAFNQLYEYSKHLDDIRNLVPF